MSPRAASRLESIGFERVYNYVAGKADWGSAGLALEGENGSETRAGAHIRTDVPTCRPAIPSKQSANSSTRAAGTPASSSTSGASSSVESGDVQSAGEGTSRPRRR